MKTRIAMLCFLPILGINMNAHLNNADTGLTEQAKMTLDKLIADNEEDTIKKAIIAETDHYFARDIVNWKNCFVDSEKTAIIQKYANGDLLSVTGMDEMEARTKKAFKENPDMDFKIMDRLHWNICIEGNVAWVNFKENQMINGTERLSEEIRVLVKEKGKWKIAFVSSIY